MMFALLLAIKVTLICGIALAVTGMAHRSRASVRHLVLSGAFITLLALPFGAWLEQTISIEIPILERHSNAMTEAAYSEEEPATKGNAGTPTSSLVAAEQTSVRLSTVIAVIWVSGTALSLLSVVVGLWQLHNLRRSGSSWPRGETICAQLAAGQGTDRQIAVLIHGTIHGPMTCGVFRPAIMFPRDAQSWTDEAVRRALVHELEHIRRRDCLMHMVARLACAVYWFHPLVWMSWRKLGLEAERSCDDAVLSQCVVDATEYADQLVKLASHISAAAKMPLLAMANRSDLSTRVTAVLDSGQRRGRPGKLCVAGVFVLCALFIGVVSPLRAVSTFREPAAQGRSEFEVASIKPKGPFRRTSHGGSRLLTWWAGQCGQCTHRASHHGGVRDIAQTDRFQTHRPVEAIRIRRSGSF